MLLNYFLGFVCQFPLLVVYKCRYCDVAQQFTALPDELSMPRHVLYNKWFGLKPGGRIELILGGFGSFAIKRKLQCP